MTLVAQFSCHFVRALHQYLRMWIIKTVHIKLLVFITMSYIFYATNKLIYTCSLQVIVIEIIPKIEKKYKFSRLPKAIIVVVLYD